MTVFRRVIRFSLGFVVACGLLGSVPAAAQEVVRAGGTGAGTIILQRMVELYKETRPDARVVAVMPPLGSIGGLNALAAGAIQVAIVARPSDPEKVPDASSEFWVRTPFVLVARDVPDGTNLSRSQVADILAGRLLQWPNGNPIRPILRFKSDTDTKLLGDMSPDIAASLEVAFKRPGIPAAEHDIHNQQLLESTPGAFGVMSLSQQSLASPLLKPLTLDGVKPSVATLLSGAYPYERKFYLVVGKSPSASTREFLAYLRSPATLDYLRNHGLIASER
ncbi:MAG: substrate-binding domain-containing protein [Alphaproteobacteria bacterium]